MTLEAAAGHGTIQRRAGAACDDWFPPGWLVRNMLRMPLLPGRPCPRRATRLRLWLRAAMRRHFHRVGRYSSLDVESAIGAAFQPCKKAEVPLAPPAPGRAEFRASAHRDATPLP